MKFFLATLLLIGTLSANATGFLPIAEAAVPLLDAAGIHIKINATQFWLGFNQQLNLVTNDAALTCAGDFLPTIEYLSEVAQLIENFRFGQAFDEIDPLIDILKKFKAECQPVYQAYGTYFQKLATAWDDDQEAVLRTFVHTLVANKQVALLKGAELAAAIISNDSTAAGQAFVDFLKVGLVDYLPQSEKMLILNSRI